MFNSAFICSWGATILVNAYTDEELKDTFKDKEPGTVVVICQNKITEDPTLLILSSPEDCFTLAEKMKEAAEYILKERENHGDTYTS